MKNILTISMCLLVMKAHGQLGLIVGAGAGIARHAMDKSQVPLTEFRYKIDSFEYKGERVAIQRYNDRQLGKAAGEYSVDMALKQDVYFLQRHLDDLQRCVVSGSLRYTRSAEESLEKIARDGAYFNTSNYERELALYQKACGVKSSKEMREDERRQQVAKDSMRAVQNEKERLFRLRDPNVITEEDRQLAAEYHSGDGYGVATMAQRKIERIEEAEANRKRDSTHQEEARRAAIAEKKEARKEALATAAKQKKDKAAAQARAEKRKADLIAKYGQEDGSIIAAGKVDIGMTKEMCIAAWGKPADMNRTITAGIVYEQWIYNQASILNFENDILVSVQN